MKLFQFIKQNKKREVPKTTWISFDTLSKTDQEKILKKGAEEFSKKFTKVITTLANE